MKKYLLTGFIILLPAALTFFIVLFIFDLFTTPFISLVEPLVAKMDTHLPFAVPQGFALLLSRILSLILLCVFILVLGVITQAFVAKTFMKWLGHAIERIPVVSSIYKLSVDIFGALLSTDGKKAFKRPVMIPFPSQTNFCVGFVAGEVAEEIREKIKEPLVSVFSPTAPHPISGFLLLVPEKDVKEIDMTNEEIVKFLVSCGTILPKADEEANDDYF